MGSDHPHSAYKHTSRGSKGSAAGSDIMPTGRNHSEHVELGTVSGEIYEGELVGATALRGPPSSMMPDDQDREVVKM